MTPNTGQAGDVITVNGTSFLSGASITICGQTVGTIFISSTQVTFVAPPCALTDAQDVTLTNPDGGFATAPDAFTYVDDADDDPTITGITPSEGPPAGGTNVTITGSDFQPGATVAVRSVAGDERGGGQRQHDHRDDARASRRRRWT